MNLSLSVACSGEWGERKGRDGLHKMREGLTVVL